MNPSHIFRPVNANINDSIEEELMRESGAVHGYSLIKLVQKEEADTDAKKDCFIKELDQSEDNDEN